MTETPIQNGTRMVRALFWIWIVVVLALYVGSFGPVLRLLSAYLSR